MSDQSLQFLEDGLAWVVGWVEAVWAWSSDQMARMAQTPWESWPLWKQILFVIVTAAVIYILFLAALQLWGAVLNVVSAVATFIGTLIVTLPTIVLAGAIALAGLWVINNFSSLRSPGTFQDGDIGLPNGHGTPPSSVPPAKQNPADTIDRR